MQSIHRRCSFSVILPSLIANIILTLKTHNGLVLQETILLFKRIYRTRKKLLSNINCQVLQVSKREVRKCTSSLASPVPWSSLNMGPWEESVTSIAGQTSALYAPGNWEQQHGVRRISWGVDDEVNMWTDHYKESFRILTRGFTPEAGLHSSN